MATDETPRGTPPDTPSDTPADTPPGTSPHTAPDTTRDTAVVVLVDAMGQPRGTMPKLDAHRAPGHWHAAFSAVLYDPDGRMLLQRRAADKYHFAGRWTNACCSHPAPGETIEEAVRRRVPEELGLHLDEHRLGLAGSFWYRAEDPDSGRWEREYDTVVVVHDVDPGSVAPVADEVDEVAWLTTAAVAERCAADPDGVTPWLPRVLDVLAGFPDVRVEDDQA